MSRPRMPRHVICDIDQLANTGPHIPVDTALRNVVKYIRKNIDPTFPPQAFRDWVDSDTEEPFTWNKAEYYWEHSDV